MKGKRMLKKILKKVKQFFEWILKNIKPILLIVGSLFVVMTLKRVTAIFGEVKEERNWEPVPGDKTKVFLWDKYNNKVVVKLPIHPKTGKQIKSNEVVSVGLSTEKEEGLNVEIMHTPVNRRNSDFVSGDFSG